MWVNNRGITLNLLLINKSEKCSLAVCILYCASPDRGSLFSSATAYIFAHRKPLLQSPAAALYVKSNSGNRALQRLPCLESHCSWLEQGTIWDNGLIFSYRLSIYVITWFICNALWLLSMLVHQRQGWLGNLYAIPCCPAMWDFFLLGAVSHRLPICLL